MEVRAFRTLSAEERREANAAAHSKTSELRVETDQLLAQTETRLELGKQALLRAEGRRPG